MEPPRAGANAKPGLVQMLHTRCTLGRRESGTARLEQAVQAYRAALEVGTRERVPLDWASTQNNLGNALRTMRARGARAAPRAWNRPCRPTAPPSKCSLLKTCLGTTISRKTISKKLS